VVFPVLLSTGYQRYGTTCLPVWEASRVYREALAAQRSSSACAASSGPAVLPSPRPADNSSLPSSRCVVDGSTATTNSGTAISGACLPWRAHTRTHTRKKFGFDVGVCTAANGTVPLASRRAVCDMAAPLNHHHSIGPFFLLVVPYTPLLLPPRRGSSSSSSSPCLLSGSPIYAPPSFTGGAHLSRD
jgi:hypothetical protein